MGSSDNENTGSVASVIQQVLEVITFVVPLIRMLIDNGKDAPTEIKRILSADAGLAAMRAEWDERLNKKFGADG